MHSEPSLFKKVRCLGSVSSIYALTLLFAWYALQPVFNLSHTRPISLTRAEQIPHLPTSPAGAIISGKPVRIVIPDSKVDLPIDPGFYNSADNSWTLSGYRAQFAMISTLANNSAGDTFIYGHNNNYVFGALRHVTPNVGSQAFLYTDNGHIFAYSFQSSNSLTPSDVAVLNYKGPPMLTIQTCTGSIDEWRTVFKYKFDQVIQ